MAKFLKLTSKSPKLVKPVKLTAGQKAAATKRANKLAAVAAAEAEAVRIASLTPGQKAAETKRAAGTHFTAAAKAAATKRANAAAKPVAVSKPVAGQPVAGQPDLMRALQIAQALIASGLV